MVAGEASGDLLGMHLIGALKERRPGLRFAGIGGPRMQAQGFESYFPMEKLSVHGYADALRNYREIAGIRRQLAERLLAQPPALFVGVDAPDFNLGLEQRLREAGVPTVHYVGPSIWAWRGGRIGKIRRATTHMLVLFPFERPLYEKAGIPVTYVGHPLADLIPLKVDKAEARAQLRLPPGKRIVALLPGSRESELKYMADLFVKTAHRFVQELSDAHFVCPTPTRRTREMFEAALHRNRAQDLPLTLLFGHSHEALAAAEVALVASGTATLEAALFGTPMVITYRISPLNWIVMRPMAYLSHFGLPNVLAGEEVVPELLQGMATPWALSSALLDLVQDPARQRRQVEKFHEMHLALRQDTANKAAEAVLGVLDAARP
jgi:lipid-A-disaccharide synthase